MTSKMATSMNQFLFGIVLFAFYGSNVLCHLCMLSPKQRGSINGLNKAGSNDCLLVKPECGGRPAEPQNTLVLRSGQNLTVIFQKNLNHWTAATPGEFRVQLGQESDTDKKFQVLAKIPDNNEPNLYLYSAMVQIPSYRIKQPLVLQTVYQTNNPQAPPMFYQCSDVIIM